MIIPRAIFLRHAWLKNKVSMETSARNEKTMMAGELIRRLRAPGNHRAGVLSCFFPSSLFPVMSSGSCPEMMEGLVRDFESAGYRVSTEWKNDGVSVTLDWRDVQEENPYSP
ncbi:hypothetical protein [Enterobacter hormaechei]|uniref:hypothetical protein n=1 Tax=Enterobacter hormaechei TaxID=158836 RepID=UPI0032DB54A5